MKEKFKNRKSNKKNKIDYSKIKNIKNYDDRVKELKSIWTGKK